MNDKCYNNQEGGSTMDAEKCLIYRELKRLNTSIEKNTEILTNHRIESAKEIATLKTKSKLWGSVAGFLAGMIPLTFQYWFTHKK